MVEFEKSEFLSPQQCFIIYDKLTKECAVSMRNRLSAKDVKCTVWDEKQFRDNEGRFSNFNRILFLSQELVKVYLANPELIPTKVTNYVSYKQEGRTGGLYLNDGIPYIEIYENRNKQLNEIKKKIKEFSPVIKEKLKSVTKEELVSLLLNYGKSEETTKNASTNLNSEKSSETIKYLSLIGVSASMAVTLASMVSVLGLGVLGLGTIGVYTVFSPITIFGVSWYSLNKEKKCKKMLLFEAIIKFEKELLDDFVNAK